MAQKDLAQKDPAQRPQILIIGGGAWGAAIAAILTKQPHLDATCLVRDEATAKALSSGIVPRLDNMPLPCTLDATTDEALIAHADAIYLVLPAAATGEAIALIERTARPDCPIILCAKGLIDVADTTGSTGTTALLLPEFMKQAAPNRAFAMLSGPSFADEVIKGLPCALVASSSSKALADEIVRHFTHSTMRLYSNDDPMGVAVGGAVKNVIALAAGISAGLGLGDNAKAALITRGLAETGRLIKALGGNPNVLNGLAGMGDLTLTAAGPHSRNMAYGLALGAGKPLPDALAEGARTAPILHQRATALGIEMPITHAVTKALQGADLTMLITELLARPPAPE